jgi:hypothetical protein
VEITEDGGELMPGKLEKARDFLQQTRTSETNAIKTSFDLRQHFSDDRFEGRMTVLV